MSTDIYENQPTRWITWRGRRLPIGADGKILKVEQEQVNNLKSKSSFVSYGTDNMLDAKRDLRVTNSHYRKVNNIKKSYEKKGKVYDDLDYWKETKKLRDEAQNKYDEEIKKYKNTVWGQINIKE